MPDLVDLKYSKAEAKEEQAEYAKPSSMDYPYGLNLSLEKRELDLLGIEGVPAVGDEWHMTIVAKVYSVNTSSGPDADDSIRVGLQVCMAQVDSQESAAEEAREKKTPAVEAAETKRARPGGVMGS